MEYPAWNTFCESVSAVTGVSAKDAPSLATWFFWHLHTIFWDASTVYKVFSEIKTQLYCLGKNFYSSPCQMHFWPRTCVQPAQKRQQNSWVVFFSSKLRKCFAIYRRKEGSKMRKVLHMKFIRTSRIKYDPLCTMVQHNARKVFQVESL